MEDRNCSINASKSQGKDVYSLREGKYASVSLEVLVFMWKQEMINQAWEILDFIKDLEQKPWQFDSWDFTIPNIFTREGCR